MALKQLKPFHTVNILYLGHLVPILHFTNAIKDLLLQELLVVQSANQSTLDIPTYPLPRVNNITSLLLLTLATTHLYSWVCHNITSLWNWKGSIP